MHLKSPSQKKFLKVFRNVFHVVWVRLLYILGKQIFDACLAVDLVLVEGPHRMNIHRIAS